MQKTFIYFHHRVSDGLASSSVIRPLFRFVAVSLAGLHALAAISSQSMNADGISYLDIGDAYFHGDWDNAINAVWSPLYSLILGVANFVFKPSMQWEFPTVHIINFLIFLGTLASFEFMWGNVRITEIQNESHRMPDWLWWTLGYLLFIWTSLSLIQIWSVTPDMLMAAFVYLAAGLIARIRAGEDHWRLFLSLGLILGLGYLSKTFMFAVSPIFLGLAWLVEKRTWASLSKVLLSLGIFLLISLPFVLLISEKKGKLTIGEAGTVTYLRYANGMPFPHWQGDPLRGIIPSHPSRMIHRSPTIYEFGEPLEGTYPISIDPSYWYEGIEPRFDFGGLLARLFASGLVYLELFLQKQGILFAGVLALYVMGQKHKHRFFEILKRWGLVIPALIAFGLYGTVLVEDRYVGVFVLLFWADVLANIQLPDNENNRLWLKTLGVMASLGLMANIVMFNLDGFKRLNPSLGDNSVQQAALPAKPLEVAQALHELGVGQGDKVGVIGYAYDSFWARLARVKIVAEMLDADANELWHGDEALRQSVLQAFANAGADAVVAEYVPEYVKLNDWHQVEDSNYYIYVFTEQ
jgi:4-amino-4-deoxy-L-arabinose transferase-like glycosyltransferase